MGINVYRQHSYLFQKFAGTFKHLQEFYSLVFKHGLVFSKSKMEIGKRDIEFLGYKISKGHVILQEHVLKVFAHFLLGKSSTAEILGKPKLYQAILQRTRI